MKMYCSYCGEYDECTPHLNNATEKWCCTKCYGKSNQDELDNLIEDLWTNFEQLKREDVESIIMEAYELGKVN